jgi:hypothetical protein
MPTTAPAPTVEDMRRFALLLSCALVAGALFATSALGATRFASPTGAVSMTATCTDAALPCSIGTALGAARSGDNLSLANGVYDLQGKTLPGIPLHWLPTDPTTRPILTSNSTVPTLSLVAAQSGTTIDHLEIDNHGPQSTSASASALLLDNGATDVTVRSTVLSGLHCVEQFGLGTFEVDDSTLTATKASTCLVAGPNSRVRRSTVQPPGAVLSTAKPPPIAETLGLIEDTTVSGGLELDSPTAVARRVTASGVTGIVGQGLVVDSFAEGFGSEGAAIEVGPFGGTLRVVGSTAIGKRAPALFSPSVTSQDPTDPNSLVVTDSILSSIAPADIQATPLMSCPIEFRCQQGTIALDHSLFNTRSPAPGAPGADVITDGAGNRSGDPRFTDPIRNDYRLLPGSPAIDAGVVDALAAPLDLDGRPRVQGRAPDLGAFETTAPPPGTAGSGGPGGGSIGGGGPKVRAAIALSSLGIKPSHFHVDGRAKIRFTLDSAASVKLTFARKVRKGHRKIFRTVGHLTVPNAKAGANTVLFLGRVGGKPLRQGSYRLTATPAGGKARTIRLNVLP